MSRSPPIARSPPGPKRSGHGSVQLFVILGAVVALVALLVFLGRGDRLEKSAIGFDGLGVWLRQNGVETVPLLRAAKEGEPQTTLRILPIYDASILDDFEEELPDAEKRLGTVTQRSLGVDRFNAKLAEAPTLAVLPKWRSGFPAGGKAHPDLLIPLDRIWFYGAAVTRVEKKGFGTYELTDASGSPPIGTVSAYSLQVLGSDFLDQYCDPLVTIRDVGAILAQCLDFEENAFFVLSDPDLLDNHGLALGDNAAVALKLVAMAGRGAGKGPVFIDYAAGPDGDEDATKADSGAQDADAHERTLADLSRFFAYPFSYVWAGFVLLMGLALWRGSRRFGQAVEDGGDGDSSKRRTIAASGRILRLAGTEGDLVDAHVRARMDALATALLRPRKAAAGEDAEAARIEQLLARRSPALAKRFSSARRGVAAAGISERSRFDALAQFELALQEIWHEFGRASDPSRQHRR